VLTDRTEHGEKGPPRRSACLFGKRIDGSAQYSSALLLKYR
jgi:hypothetical protein